MVERERFFTGVRGFSGLLALTLGAVGAYGVMALAIWIPARRAGKADPARALSAE